jgi:hypothetical protein
VESVRGRRRRQWVFLRAQRISCAHAALPLVEVRWRTIAITLIDHGLAMAGIDKKHDPGGKVRLAISPDVKSSAAVFGGPDNCYRYQLRRTWDETKPHAMFIMMNPSIADSKQEDPSVAKCGRFARSWGYGGIYVGNTFAYRATDKKRLRVCDDPIGPENNKHLIEMAKLAKTVIFAYGQPGHRSLRDRGRLLAKILIDKGVKPHVLKLSKDGTPCHPLYLRKDLEPVVWKL